jgi:hypothetical protein
MGRIAIRPYRMVAHLRLDRGNVPPLRNVLLAERSSNRKIDTHPTYRYNSGSEKECFGMGEIRYSHESASIKGHVFLIPKHLLAVLVSRMGG